MVVLVEMLVEEVDMEMILLEEVVLVLMICF
jgi:hypothetical protein